MFHVGGARSALYNWAVAHRAGGTFVLRVEDTDAARNRPEWTDQIISALAWIGISADDEAFEGPYFQSDYVGEHQDAALRLYHDHHAYYCDCTREDVVARTGSQHQGYDGYCRDRGLDPGHGRALRFHTPDTGEVVVDDRVRGRVEFPCAAMEDFVIARGDGTPLFNLANVVDDMAMRITAVIRAEEHLSNAPKQQLLWQALGATPPVWAHLPVIVNEKRQKLSKRRDKVALESYRDEGYLPEAMVNYLMLLGWGPGGDREIMPYREMEERFGLDAVNGAPAFFDEKKLRAFNGEYIRGLSVDDFIARCDPWLREPNAPWQPDRFDPAVFAAVAPLAQTRVAVLSEIVQSVDFLFLDEPVRDEASWRKGMVRSDEGEGARRMLTGVLEVFEFCEWTAAALKSVVEEIGTANGMKLGKAQAPVRVAVTGRTVGLPLFESLEQLGRERSIARVRSALAALH